MSWCGGGEIRPTPGVEWRTAAMWRSTLWPGSWPPSPGLAPWAILICSSSALTRYSVGHSEPARGDLLDRRALESPLGSGEAVALLAALAGVRLAADPVHRHRERGMRLAADRAEAHRAGREALDDFAGRLDLVERHGRPGRLEVPAARGWSAAAGSVRSCSSAKARYLSGRLPRTACWRLATRVEGPGMRLAADPLGVEPAEVERCPRRRHRRRGAAAAVSSASSARPMPSIMVAVPVKYWSTSLLDRPIASKICAPQ